MIWIRKIHKWASVLVAIQFLLWLLSGLYFNLMDPVKAHGNSYRSKQQLAEKIDVSQLVAVKRILQQSPQAVNVKLISLVGKPYYLLNHKRGLYKHLSNQYSLINALTGELVSMDSKMVNTLAQASYSGSGDITSTQLITAKISEFPKQKNPTWQINFNDALSTSVYIEDKSGRIVGHSDDDKRLADIAFKLHFLDYGNVGGFNNMQNYIFAFLALWLSFTGIIWTIELALKGRYKLRSRRK
ncbi:hypothetical protein AADZ86_18215 [Colwelliaceae bacterium BS250]